jgi:hypothetical protein
LKKLLHGADALRHEELLALAGSAPLEVAS